MAHFRLVGEATARATFQTASSSPRRSARLRASLIAVAEADDSDLLDDYIEAQVHGPPPLARDVEALVLDPCYRGMDVERAARTLPCALEWHGGFRLRIDELERHPHYRGHEYLELGRSLAEDGLLTPRTIGDAARAGCHDLQAEAGKPTRVFAGHVLRCIERSATKPRRGSPQRDHLRRAG